MLRELQSVAPQLVSSVRFLACSVIATSSADCRQTPADFLRIPTGNHTINNASTEILQYAYSALAVLQNDYYQVGRNTWPLAIDWTAAVTQTVVSGMLSTLTRSLDLIDPGVTPGIRQAQENLISSLYDQIIGYHYAQDIVAIKDEAFDDILWVVLGWIEAINFARLHGNLYFPEAQHEANTTYPTDIHAALTTLPWRGQFWIPSFQSRAQSFWLLGAQGWDTELCHGGMIWNPRLEPYKNAITNELYISASVAMYQHLLDESAVDKDPAYLQAAIEGYKWLVNSNMTNDAGLFVDGFHIGGLANGGIECNVRDEMVYTYNQGVLLTGQRGLWEATGSPSYLTDGHNLIQAVINATGWDLETNQPTDPVGTPSALPIWRGLGRGGILEDECDASGTCSQDSQTFKGIYFHHLNQFCRPLDGKGFQEHKSFNVKSFNSVRAAHRSACQAYLDWIEHNAVAALETRDEQGRFGMWWGAGLVGNSISVSPQSDGIDHDAANTTDYRNHGTPVDDTWGRTSRWLPGPQKGGLDKQVVARQLANKDEDTDMDVMQSMRKSSVQRKKRQSTDPNDRGRGRTVETQVGGLAVLRAYWDVSQSVST
ncbi:glycoside hydrolase family 76 protein [Trichoderma longibrachiatum]|uniref:Glycoside hydrolase family 76 protein n=1 Tax=Trichoderma longibrachiatum ATCC 18648 TaxID=983965 RepID=A0A2T4BQ62_TRILO|nr:glycoside hydrolase family 76 protein [Trichoderma longibrachiatum ATCC 18648]